jgi:hypothetical protein
MLSAATAGPVIAVYLGFAALICKSGSLYSGGGDKPAAVLGARSEMLA